MRFRALASLACVFAVMASLSGCATTEAYQTMLNGWVGKNVDQLVAAWGPPNASYTFKDGRRSVQYTDSTTQHYPPMTTYDPYSGQSTVVFDGYSRTLNCVTTFETDSKGIIRSWKWHGNNCVAVPKHDAGSGPKTSR